METVLQRTEVEKWLNKLGVVYTNETLDKIAKCLESIDMADSLLDGPLYVATSYYFAHYLGESMLTLMVSKTATMVAVNKLRGVNVDDRIVKIGLGENIIAIYDNYMSKVLVQDELISRMLG